MRGRAIEVIIQLFHILAVVTLRVRKAKIPFFYYWVFFIPKCYGKTQILLIVTNTRNALFAPAVGFTTGHIMGDIVPRVAISAVVFTHSAPLAVAHIRSPFFPAITFF